MHNLLKGVLATITTIILIAFPTTLARTPSQTSSFQDTEISDIILIQKNSLVGHSGVLTGIEAELWGMARKYKIDYDRFYDLGFCESTLNPDAVGEAGEIGILQFLQSTFSDYAERYNMVGFSIHNTSNQIELAAQMLASGKASEWTCLY